VYGIRVSVYVGFRKTQTLTCVGFLCIVMSRKLILCSSVSYVKRIFGCSVLNSLAIVLMSVCWESNMTSKSSTYRK
jgi:hypothetical protein